MINFDEEIKRFKPSVDIGNIQTEVEKREDMDLNEFLINYVKGMKKKSILDEV
jgi:hypothetical protein